MSRTPPVPAFQVLVYDNGTVFVWQRNPGLISTAKHFVPKTCSISVKSDEGGKLQVNWNREKNIRPQIHLTPVVVPNARNRSKQEQEDLKQSIAGAGAEKPGFIGLDFSEAMGWNYIIAIPEADRSLRILYISVDQKEFYPTRFKAIEEARKHLADFNINPETVVIDGVVKEIPKQAEKSEVPKLIVTGG